jgi:hypothetical protein
MVLADTTLNHSMNTIGVSNAPQLTAFPQVRMMICTTMTKMNHAAAAVVGDSAMMS